MFYSLPLEKRLRIAARRKERYWNEPEYRLGMVNRSRARRGLPPVSDLSEISDPRKHLRPGPPDAPRDERGRFA